MPTRRLRASPALATAFLAVFGTVSQVAAQATVSINKLYVIETIFVADFAPYNVGQQPDFLAITINNGSTRDQSVKLRLTISQTSPQSVLLFEGTTDPFTLTGPVRRITNRDLSNQNSDVVIEDFEIGEGTDDLTKRMQETGRFPSGTYSFAVQITTPAGALLSQAQTQVDLVNPTRVELVAPGRVFGDQPELVTSPTPRFVWSADEGLAGGLGSYKIRVVPVGAAASPEEAMQSFASWEGTTTQTSAVYPASVSAMPLAAGQTYAWQVTREVKTSGGTQQLISPIYWFKMSGGESKPGATQGGGGNGGSVGATLRLDQLSQGLGLGNELKGFQPTGQIIVDGKPVSSENLEALIRAILSGQVTIHAVDVQ